MKNGLFRIIKKKKNRDVASPYVTMQHYTLWIAVLGEETYKNDVTILHYSLKK